MLPWTRPKGVGFSKPVHRSSALLFGVLVLHLAAAAAQPLPAPILDNPKTRAPFQTAVLAGGCFWGVQGVFEHVRGVRSVLSGYAGGEQSTAQYHLVSTGTTGHAETVEIRFDPEVVSFGDLLRIFFSVVHDPTELNRQGPDVGSQYRSEIFAVNEQQAAIARAYIAQLQKAGAFEQPIVTRVSVLKGFYLAEDVHQDFLLNYPSNPYIVLNDLPKIRQLQDQLPQYYRAQPVRVGDHPIPVDVLRSSSQ